MAVEISDLLTSSALRTGTTAPHAPRLAKPASSSLERWLTTRIWERLGRPALMLILWDGYEVGTRSGPSQWCIRIHDRFTLWLLAYDPLYQFGQAYSSGRLEVQGDLSELLTNLYRNMLSSPSRWSDQWPLGSFRWIRRNSLDQSRGNIHHHYDIGNEFYRLWLDRRMLYTCAYFNAPSQSLEDAQVAKMDHICRKLRLRPGETVVEAGCGWGALALHMARHYGVTVRAFNISHEQVLFARQLAQEAGLAGRVEFVEDDWRHVQGTYDAFVSVGMLEHVGLPYYHQLGDVIHRCLAAEGRGLIHSIAQDQPRPLNRWIEHRIFPGAYPPSLREMLAVLEPHAFSVLDVENLRLHYATTLRHWLQRYERSVGTVRKMFGLEFERSWRLYLAGSIAAFESGSLQLFQVLFTREGCNSIPRTRAHQYWSSTAERDTVVSE